MDRSLSKFQEIVEDREAWCAAVHGATKSWTWLSNWVTTNLCPTLLWPHGLWSSRLLCPYDVPGKNTRVGCISFSRGSSQLRDQTCVSCTGRGFLSLGHQGSPWSSGSYIQYLAKTCNGKEPIYISFCLSTICTWIPFLYTWNQYSFVNYTSIENGLKKYMCAMCSKWLQSCLTLWPRGL